MRTSLVFSLAALLLVGFTGCGKSVAKKPGAEGAAGATDNSNLPVLGVAPAWKLKDLEGREVKLSDYHGKVVLVDFWATWCVPCRSEMPDYVALQKKYADRGLVIIGISLDAQGAGVVKKFAEGLSINYQIVMGDDTVTEAYKVQLMPTTVLIDRKGQMRHQKVGAIQDFASYEHVIASLL